MARPWKHPDSGICWLRRAVPADLRKLVGKREEKRSLGTRDPAEAKRLHAQPLMDLEARWANVRAGPRTLSERECHELATVAHDRWLETHKDDPSRQKFWPVNLGEKLWAPPPSWNLNESFSANLLAGFDDDRFKAEKLERWRLGLADECLTPTA